MQVSVLNDIAVHWREDGDPAGAPVVFANSLGTDLRLWDTLLPLLPQGLRYIRYDKRGHGLSDCPAGPYSMGTLIRDAEALLDHLEVRDCVFVGLSVGGLIAQGLAVKRLDQVRAMVLSNTAAKIGTREMWEDRMTVIRDGGLEAIADGVMERWFAPDFRKTDEMRAWRNMLAATRAEGYLGVCAAIAGTDFITPTSGLRIPTLGITGSDDATTPADLVRETTDLVPGSRFELIRRAGHLPCVEQPEAYAAVLTQFLKEVGHV